MFVQVIFNLVSNVFPTLKCAIKCLCKWFLIQIFFAEKQMGFAWKVQRIFSRVFFIYIGY